MKKHIKLILKILTLLISRKKQEKLALVGIYVVSSATWENGSKKLINEEST